MDFEGFHSTLGREFCEALSGWAPDDATRQDMLDVVLSTFGKEFSPPQLESLTSDDIERLRLAFIAYFEIDGLPQGAVVKALKTLSWHWPAADWPGEPPNIQ